MSNIVPNHFSDKLEFNYQKRHSFLTDRVHPSHLIPGIIFGFLLCLLGIYEGLHAFRAGGEELIPSDAFGVSAPVFDVYLFDLCFFVIGIGLFCSNVFLYLRYNKYKFDNDTVTIIKRPIFKDKLIIQEKLKNYNGVRFRVEFLQSGFLLKNRYVIELYHKNPEKIVPLYLSTSDKDVRLKWKAYAKAFKLPAMIDTDDGLKSIDLKNLNKSLAALNKLGLVEDTYDAYDNFPTSLAFARKKDKIVIKIRKALWDIYNLLAWMAIFMLSALMLLIWANMEAFKQVFSSPIYTILFLGTMLVLVSIQILFRKEKLVLKKNKIVHTHKYLLFSTKHNEMMKKDIEAIEVAQNPVTGRYFVSIISEDNIITFGTKLSIDDLQWIKRFLVHEIIRS